jgi:streptogramin lyase
VVAGGGYIWLGDNVNWRIVRLDPSRSEFTFWDIANNAYPTGLVWSPRGDLWWADNWTGTLGRLEPALNRVTTYVLPAVTGGQPAMLTARGGQIWYTEDVSGTVGALSPGQASGTSVTKSPQTVVATAACQNLGNGTSAPAVVRTNTLTWTETTYGSLPNIGSGWTTYQLPDGAWPWGITAHGNQVYAVDQYRHMLLSLTLHDLYLPVVKHP